MNRKQFEAEAQEIIDNGDSAVYTTNGRASGAESIVRIEITTTRVRFVALEDTTFAELVRLCEEMAGWKPEHAHIMPADRKVGGPDHIDFWHWKPDGTRYVISHDLPSWETGEVAEWDDVAVSAGDSVSLDAA